MITDPRNPAPAAQKKKKAASRDEILSTKISQLTDRLIIAKQTGMSASVIDTLQDQLWALQDELDEANTITPETGVIWET